MGTVVSFPELGWDVTVKRVAFTVGGASVYWYGILIALGALLAVIYAFRKFREFGLDPDRAVDAIIVGTIGAIIGARLYYVAFSAPGEFSDIASIFDIRSGGVAFYGAIIGALLSAVLMCKIRKIKLRPMADLAAIGFLIGQGVGRWGNFLNQEAFGANTSLPWGMTSSTVVDYLLRNQSVLESHGMRVDPAMPVHPTFLYESIWCLVGFALFALYVKRRKFDGEIFLMYLAWNGAGRSVIEGLRTDSLYIGTVRVSQLLAFCGFMVSVLAIFIIRKNLKMRRERDPDYAMPYGHTEQCETDMALLAAEREEKKNKKAKKGGDSGKKADSEEKDGDSSEEDAANPEENAVTDEENSGDSKESGQNEESGEPGEENGLGEGNTLSAEESVPDEENGELGTAAEEDSEKHNDPS